MKQKYFAKIGKDKNELLRFQSVSGQSKFKRSTILQAKSIKLSFIAFVLISMLWSCDYLNYTESDQYNKDEIFKYIDRAETILTNVYSYLPTDYSSVGGAMRSSATDDAEHVYDISDVQKFNDGSWNSIVTLDDQWSNMYAAIRNANFFQSNAPGLSFESIKYNANYKDLMKAYVIYPYEARFLRAFYYFELAKRYGGVPLDTTLLTSAEANNISRASYDDVVKFVVRECDSAITKLPVSYATAVFISGETGRATKGAAMALKARTLLYAASPLHNPTNDLSKWVAAARAAKALIDQLGSTYTPLPAYTLVVNSISSSAKELILEVRNGTTRTFEAANTAIGFIGGSTGTCPTQNLVDAYEMKQTGLGINEPGSGYNPATPYATSGAAQRDPRLAMSILYNGAIWKTPQIVKAYYGGLNGPPTANATKTGYYLKKYMVESVSLNPISLSTAYHYWVLFRYAEVLLNYAEAMNEAYGPEVSGQAPLNNLTALQAVNIVRARTGVAMPAFSAGMSQSAFRDKLWNERRVELAFEDHRFWDIRRWKIGPSTTTIRGVDATLVTLSPFVSTYTPKIVETRKWDDKMYLYPIPQTELFINKNLVQNPGW